MTHQVVGESEREVTTQFVRETGVKGSTMCKENTKGVKCVDVTAVGTHLGELEWEDIGKLSLASFKDGELMARSEEVDK